MDPSLPTAAALAIAGDRIAGGVGTHESALPTPDRVDLRGTVRPPRLHRRARPLPDLVAGAARRPLEGVAIARRGARPRPARTRAAASGSAAAAGATPTGPSQPTRQALDEVTGDTPAALWSKDYHSLWLNSAALARAGGDLEVPGGVVERDARRRADRRPARGVRLAVPRASRHRLGGRVGRGHTRGAQARRTRAASARSTTRTAGSAPRRSSAGSTSRAGSRCGSGSRSPPTTSTGSRSSACARGSATTTCGSAT